jgi:hypothetical protein
MVNGFLFLPTMKSKKKFQYNHVIVEYKRKYLTPKKPVTINHELPEKKEDQKEQAPSIEKEKLVYPRGK